ncbi:hypothetical protein, partial [Enterococcus faecium]|uniref:hypothetical protein n=1 Tax=Enterococcus faecium TaxID=1352 RepID=UPI0021E98970
MKNKWINRSKKKKVTQRSSDKVIRLFPSYKEGLTADQVKERIEKGAANNSVDPTFKTNQQIVLENIFTPVVLVNFNILKNISKFLQNVVVLDL